MSEGTLWNYTCSNKGLLLPLINEYTWSRNVRACLYFVGLVYCFLGIAIIADIFMCAIEKITSKTRKITLSTVKENEPEIIEVKVWNDTVANLTLMALGSSAPEILLSIIEIIGNGFEAGELGPGTIVGSAAFNLLVISAICVVALPPGETRRIRTIKVFGITAFFSVFAYVWLLIILVAISPNVVELWEALLTLLFFPLLVVLSYGADRNFCMPKTKIQEKTQMGLESALDDTGRRYFPGGKVDKHTLADFIKEVRKYPGLSDEDAASLAAARLMEQQEHSRMWYRVGAIRDITGGRKPRPRLNQKLQEHYEEVMKKLKTKGKDDENKQVLESLDGPDSKAKKALPAQERKDVAILDFSAASCAVLENVGKVSVTIKRHGKLDNTVSCRVETIDGTAVSGEDYVELKEVLTFAPGETEKKLSVEIINDNQWEPDETFFLKLMINEDDAHEVALGRTCIMEITILNDDEPGILMFKKRGFLVKESIGAALIPVVRQNGVDGVVSAKWRAIDKTAKQGKDYIGTEGEITFEHGEVEKNIEIEIINDFEAEKDEHFEVELYEATGGAKIGSVNRTTITITNDDEFNSILGRMMVMTNVNIDALKLHSETWVGQIKDAMNVNGGDIENASAVDYVLHLLTFGWKVLFSLVPPTSMAGGWLTFFVSLALIGVITAVVGDLAGIFGCLVGLEDTITAITFVALGTSLPDLFASRTAARMERYADSAIGNVTGSNSVNVFLGLGLPWVIAAIYWEVKRTPFLVPAGNLGFSVGIYSACAVLCVCLLMARRALTIFGKAELGGPKPFALASCIFMISLWVLYILLSSLQVHNHI